MARTTVTLDPDVELLVRELMRVRTLSFKDAVNEAVRSGLRRTAPAAVRETPSFALGVPVADLTHALRFAAGIEDDEIARKMSTGK